MKHLLTGLYLIWLVHETKYCIVLFVFPFYLSSVRFHILKLGYLSIFCSKSDQKCKLSRLSSHITMDYLDFSFVCPPFFYSETKYCIVLFIFPFYLPSVRFHILKLGYFLIFCSKSDQKCKLSRLSSHITMDYLDFSFVCPPFFYSHHH